MATQDYYLDLTPPTDARLLFNQLRFDRLFDEVTRSTPASRCNGRRPRRDHDARYAREGLDGPSAGDYRGASAIDVRHVASHQLGDRGAAYVLLIGAELYDN